MMPGLVFLSAVLAATVGRSAGGRLRPGRACTDRREPVEAPTTRTQHVPESINGMLYVAVRPSSHHAA